MFVVLQKEGQPGKPRTIEHVPVRYGIGKPGPCLTGLQAMSQSHLPTGAKEVTGFFSMRYPNRDLGMWIADRLSL
jgi:hypothetical protein